jgi:hypothetical protein
VIPGSRSDTRVHAVIPRSGKKRVETTNQNPFLI